MNSSNTQPKKVALITGAARRIGAAIAKALHTQGFDVILHCHHSQEEANVLAHLLNQQREKSAYILPQDLMELNQAQDFIEKALRFKGRLDVLVNNASLFLPTDFLKPNDMHWAKLFKINVEVPFLLSQAAFPHIKAQKGCIINLTDIHAGVALKDYSIYCQTKAALAMQTKSLALEFAPEVRVNSVAPGAILWPEQVNALPASKKQAIIERTLLKQHGNPKWIAKAVLALVENEFITGQTLTVDGGRYMS